MTALFLKEPFAAAFGKKSVDDNGVKYNHEGHVKGHHKSTGFTSFEKVHTH